MKKDIFDRIMELPLLRVFNVVYVKYKAIILYLFFGALTTAVSVGSFVLFYDVFRLDELIANIVSWVLAVFFAYGTNRVWVFQSTAKGKALAREIVSFFAGRLTTLGIEEVLLFVFTTLLLFDGVIVKTFAQIVVLLLNYIFSKLFVFRKSK